MGMMKGPGGGKKDKDDDKPDAPKPGGAAKPEMPKPEAAKPEAAKPEVPKPGGGSKPGLGGESMPKPGGDGMEPQKMTGKAQEAPQQQAGKAAAPAGGGGQQPNVTINNTNNQAGGGQAPKADGGSGPSQGQDQTAELLKTAMKELGPIAKQATKDAGTTSKISAEGASDTLTRKQGVQAMEGNKAPESTVAQENKQQSKKDVGMGNQAPKMGQEESPDNDNKNKLKNK